MGLRRDTEFKEHAAFRRDLERAVEFYRVVDLKVLRLLIGELRAMKNHLADFPEAAPLTSEPPIRKHILKRYPYRVRYVYEKGNILLLTFEHMSRDNPL